jgi:hypothetical protein
MLSRSSLNLISGLILDAPLEVNRTPAKGNTPVGRVRLHPNLTTVGVAHLGGAG